MALKAVREIIKSKNDMLTLTCGIMTMRKTGYAVSIALYYRRNQHSLESQSA